MSKRYTGYKIVLNSLGYYVNEMLYFKKMYRIFKKPEIWNLKRTKEKLKPIWEKCFSFVPDNENKRLVKLTLVLSILISLFLFYASIKIGSKFLPSIVLGFFIAFVTIISVGIALKMFNTFNELKEKHYWVLLDYASFLPYLRILIDAIILTLFLSSMFHNKDALFIQYRIPSFILASVPFFLRINPKKKKTYNEFMTGTIFIFLLLMILQSFVLKFLLETSKNASIFSLKFFIVQYPNIDDLCLFGVTYISLCLSIAILKRIFPEDEYLKESFLQEHK